MATKRKAAGARAMTTAKQTAPDDGGARYFVTTVRLTPEQGDAVRREAMKRALERGSAKPDASEVLREALDAWMKKQAK